MLGIIFFSIYSGNVKRYWIEKQEGGRNGEEIGPEKANPGQLINSTRAVNSEHSHEEKKKKRRDAGLKIASASEEKWR